MKQHQFLMRIGKIQNGATKSNAEQKSRILMLRKCTRRCESNFVN